MRSLWCLTVSAVLACGSQGTDPPNPPAPTPAAIQVVAGNGQSAITATPVATTPVVAVLDASGRPLPGVAVAFNVLAGDGWVVSAQAITDVQGRASATWYLGAAATSQQLEARVGSLSAVFAADARRPTVGIPIFGANEFVEWIPGDMPIVISAPHGGTLLPTEIPDRTVGTTSRDLNTEELARDVVAAFVARFGKRPHIVICGLSRRKLDANREIVEAAAGNRIGERAWREYHGFIEASVAEVRRGPGKGFYIDLHGHGHDIQRLELGYLVGASKLGLPDAQLALDITMQSSSLWPLVVNAAAFPDLLRGRSSLGAYLESGGYPSVPSPSNPSPGGHPYFEGGYSTERHGTSADRRFGGVQVEANFDGVRDTPTSRAAFAGALVTAVDAFLTAHGVSLGSEARRQSSRRPPSGAPVHRAGHPGQSILR